MMTGRRSVNIYDYPEHLNPFFEDDNHTKLRFWTNTKRKSRSNSFSFQSIKDFKQSLFSRPARKRSGTSTSSSLSQLSCYHTHEKNDEPHQNDEFSRSDEKRKSYTYPTLRKLGRSFSIRNKNKKRDTSLDRTSQSSENEAAYSYTRSTISNRQTMPSEMHTHRADVTPLPRIRFHERVRNLEPEKSEEPASAIDDTNPFKEDEAAVKIPSTPSTSKPTTPPRKKKRAPPPPPLRQSSLTRKSLSAEFSLHSPEPKDNSTSEINHKDDEQTEENIARTKIEITKIENEDPDAETEISKADISKADIPKTEISKTEITRTEITKTEITKTEITKTDESKTEIPKYVIPEIEITNVETEMAKEETEIAKEETENPTSENEETASKSEEIEPFEINYNSELNISSSEISVSSETRLELQQHLNAVEDSSDLLELVQKLQLEVEKLTDDTNNNVITTNFDSGKRANFYGYDEDDYTKSSKTAPPSKININLDDDDDDVVVGAPLSPRLVRLKKDNEWIKH